MITDTTNDTLLDIKDYIDQKDEDNPSERFTKFMNFYKKSGSIDILEIASGSGNLTRYLLASQKNINIYWSSDISPAFLEYQLKYLNNNKLGNNCKFIQFDANRIPFNNESFDVVIGNSCLHHFLHYEKTIEAWL